VGMSSITFLYSLSDSSLLLSGRFCWLGYNLP
jgi:hypothetical protein